MKRLVIFLAFGVFGACTCARTPLLEQPFACSKPTDCSTGNLCIDGRCVPADKADAGVGGGGGGGGGAGGFPEGEDAGRDGGPDAGDAGETDAGDGGPPDAGTDAGPMPDAGYFIVATSPTVLTLANNIALPSANPNRCSPAITFTLSYGLDASVVAPAGGLLVTIDAGADPDSGTIFLNAGCTAAMTAAGVQVAPGQSTGQFYFSGPTGPGGTAATYVLGLEAEGFTPTTAQVPVTALPPVRWNLEVPDAGRAGECIPVTLRAVNTADAGVALPYTMSPGIMTSSSVPAFMNTYSDSVCDAGSLISATLPAQTSGKTFYVRAITGDAGYTLAANPSTSPMNLAGDSKLLQIRPAVRSGVCQSASASCETTIDPPFTNISQVLLFTQSLSNSPFASTVYARCFMLKGSLMHCDRTSIGGNLDVRWFAIEMPEVTQVQAFDAQLTSMSGDTAVGIPPPLVPVHAPSTFLLTSSQTPEMNFGGKALVSLSVLAPLPGANGYSPTINMNSALTNSSRHMVQTVTVGGMTVTRGVTSMAAGAASVKVTLGPGATTNAFLLHTHTNDDAVDTALCDRAVRGSFTGSTGSEITFSRGNGAMGTCVSNSSIPTISWELISVGARASRVVTLSPAMATNVATANFDVGVSGLDLTRSVAFASGQLGAGQGGGESDLSLSLSDFAGDAVAAHQLIRNPDGGTAPVLKLTRASANGTSRWTSFVVEFVP